MKKIVLSLCLLGVVAPQNSKAINISDALFSTKALLLGEKTQKIALVSAVFYYFFFLKKLKAIDRNGEEWAWSHVVSKFGEDQYMRKVIVGNFEKKNEIELTSIDQETGLVKTTKEKETITKADGVIGTLDAMIISKLKDFAEFLKNIKEFISFINDPAKSLGLK